ncbi:MAG: Malto-oligosyltrehalose trehalohydrolase [Candidatus Angelobacter sp.]|jgi:maltooligosyltrehalose trehalohydrolase|nr:Malto-oligosyltrehalose trehalohydrolase [Candidatus Angelobacter sp.]
MKLGATVEGAKCDFRVWAPNAKRVQMLLKRQGEAAEQAFALRAEGGGYFSMTAAASAGDRYFYVVDENKPVPDPVSRLLPEGVHGQTEIVDPNSFAWTDNRWRGIPLRDYILYELHVGTFTPEGTFDGVIGKLDYLKNELGVTVIELMPVAAFPGERNWGYDGVSPYAVQSSYGGPQGLKRLVNAAHEMGLAVVLDLVYNHMGNEGNYTRNFGPYFTDRHKTPWGEAINYDQMGDGPGSEGVREYVVENALYWLREYHMDGLRLDAVQTIYDDSSKHILAEIKENVAAFAKGAGREICVIAESDENDSKLVLPPERGGYGLDAFWSDDFHHGVHALLTDERDGYYQDFGALEQVVKALAEGFVFQGEHFKYWNRPRGTSAKEVPLSANVIALQNHDQVGNRAKGERLTALSSVAQRRAAAALLLLSPHTPLLFMGEEFDESAPFQFFTSFGDPALAEAVRNGRREEFKKFAGSWNEVPDPQDVATFERSKLNWRLAQSENEMLAWYRSLIGLRKQFVIPAERRAEVAIRDGAIEMRVPASAPKLTMVANLKGPQLPDVAGDWEKILSAADEHGAVAVFTHK